MSEYQYVAFRAVDRPLTDAELKFARQQSTRAEITRWSFENEYQYGDFHGDALGLLRRGYDVHLYYANFGIRTLAVRLPAGLPCDSDQSAAYLEPDFIDWEPDPKGPGGVLTVSPEWEPGTLEELWGFDDYLTALIALRDRLVSGDPRPLYLFWLAAAFNEYNDPADLEEPPAPAGLAECLKDFDAIAEFLGVDPFLLQAAAEGAGAAPKRASRRSLIEQSVKQLSVDEIRDLLVALLAGDAGVTAPQAAAQLLGKHAVSVWPCVTLDREGHVLLDRAQQLRDGHDEQQRRKAERARRRKEAQELAAREERLCQMRQDPGLWIRRADRLVEERGTQNYEQAAGLLAEVIEALGSDAEQRRIRVHAEHLVRKHPTLNRLKSALKKRGLWG